MTRRSIMDFGMGAIIAGFGLVFLFSKKLQMVVDLEPVFLYSIAGLNLLYGGFRIYRGFQKDYFKDEE